MALDPPDLDTGTSDQWYAYFRLMSYVPSMPYSFKEVMKEVTSVPSARRIMTAYVATACDIILMFNVNKAMDGEFLPAMESMFELPPASLLHLDANEIADLASIDQEFFRENLRDIGFTVSDQGRITAFTPPAPPAPKPAQTGPKTP